MMLQNIVVPWPGSTHDAAVLNNSRIKARFPVLAYEERIKLVTMLTVIVSTAVLQNIAFGMNEAEPPVVEGINQEELLNLIDNGQIPDIPKNDLLIRNNT
ncbi:hypothetical protein ILUMI_14828 [Ignelater luminosus]|uniref:DDE Tnp4 domain-containing protein n=1 Tax=Ignelater luminosus TaxID=2038154 RepID=A0A8K0G4G7_IGNLU|nr:hypothetical protein ILUMI_14828 [Ignelater luminosus]